MPLLSTSTLPSEVSATSNCVVGVVAPPSAALGDPVAAAVPAALVAADVAAVVAALFAGVPTAVPALLDGVAVASVPALQAAPRSTAPASRVPAPNHFIVRPARIQTS